MAEKSGGLDEETLKANIDYEKKRGNRATLIKFFEGKLKKHRKSELRL